jgi:hypothetical protein
VVSEPGAARAEAGGAVAVSLASRLARSSGRRMGRPTPATVHSQRLLRSLPRSSRQRVRLRRFGMFPGHSRDRSTSSGFLSAQRSESRLPRPRCRSCDRRTRCRNGLRRRRVTLLAQSRATSRDAGRRRLAALGG